MHEDSGHENNTPSTGADASLVTAQQAARAATLAVDNQNAERSTKPRHARRWRLAGFSALQEARVLVRRAMAQLADAELADIPEGNDPAPLPTIDCKRCGHRWQPRKHAPSKCPACSSPNYDRAPRVFAPRPTEES